jgi:hypothetical protein
MGSLTSECISEWPSKAVGQFKISNYYDSFCVSHALFRRCKRWTKRGIDAKE